jgi:hypothetical protein
MPYSIYNEDNEKMRVVRRLEEAKQLISNKPNWRYSFFRTPEQEPFFYKFEESPF